MRKLLVLIVLQGCTSEAKHTTGPGDASPDTSDATNTPPTLPTRETTTDTSEPIADVDEDGIADDEDNCIEVYNPDQQDSDGDAVGDACEWDTDGDTVPDTFDLFPDDPDLPGPAIPGLIYAHTSSELFTFDATTQAVTPVAPFRRANGTSVVGVTDLAVDRYGVVYITTFNELLICSAHDATCWSLGPIGSQNNGLTFIPAGFVLPDRDALVAVAINGEWQHYLVDLPARTATSAPLGAFGSGYTSSGDAFSVFNWGTFAAVDHPKVLGDILVRVDPSTGVVLEELAQLSAQTVYGLAGLFERVYAFDSSGTILEIDVTTGLVTASISTPHVWFGAGVATVLP